MVSVFPAAWFALCGGCFSDGPAVQSVEGTVRYDGRAVEGADVCFTPRADSPGLAATGTTDANGMYRLTSTRGGAFGKGAVTGEYDVRIMKYVDLDFTPDGSGRMAKPKHHLPEKYADVKTSGLSAIVKKGKNRIDFDLEKP